VSSLTSFNRKVVLFLATKPLTCAHINPLGLSSQCRTGDFNTLCPCKLTILSVYLDETWVNQNHCTDYMCLPNDGSDALKIPLGKGKRLIVLHAGTRSED
jgi:hypothetical protein